MADTPDLESGTERCGGSSPFAGNLKALVLQEPFCFSIKIYPQSTALCIQIEHVPFEDKN